MWVISRLAEELLVYEKATQLHGVGALIALQFILKINSDSMKCCTEDKANNIILKVEFIFWYK